MRLTSPRGNKEPVDSAFAGEARQCNRTIPNKAQAIAVAQAAKISRVGSVEICP